MQVHITKSKFVHDVSAGDQIIFDHPLSDIERAARGGLDLMIAYKDGSLTAIRGYYRHKPTVLIGDKELEHDEFMEQLEQLIAEEIESQRQHDFDVMAALDGIDHLDGLDMTTDREFEESDEIQADAEGSDGKSQTVASLDPVHPEGPELSEKPTNPVNPGKPSNPDPVLPSNPDPVVPNVPVDPSAPVVGEAFSDEREWDAYRKGETSDSNDSHITAENRLPDNGQGHTITAPQKWMDAQEAREIIESQGHTITAPQKWAEAQEKLQENSVKPEVSETTSPVAENKAPVAETTQSVTETAQSAVETTQAVAEVKAPVAGTAQPVAETRPAATVAESKSPVTETVSRDDTPVAPTSDASSIAAATPVAETKAPETSVTTPVDNNNVSESDNLVAENRPSATTPPITEAKAPETVHATEIPGALEASSASNGEMASPIAETEEPVAATPDPVEIPVVAEIPEPVIHVTSSEPLGDDLVASAPEPMPLTITGTGNAKSAVMTMRAPRMMSAAPSRAPAAEPDAAPSAQADDIPVGDDGTTEPERYESEIFFDDGVTIVRVLKQGVHGHVEQTEDGRWMYILDEAIDSGDEAGRNVVAEGDQVMLLTKDAKGVQWPVRVIVHIKDDVPELDIKGEENVETGHEAIGTLTYDFGADDWGGKMALKVEGLNDAEASTSDFSSPLVIAGQYGTLTVKADGSYSYKANPLGVGDEGGTDTFNFTITDADGDTTSLNLDGSPAKLTFTTEKPEEPEAPTIPDVSEKNLPDGTDPDNSALTVEIDIPEGFSIVSVKTDEDDHAGRIVQQDGKWVYVLDRPIDSGDEQGQNRVEEGDRHTVIVQDQYGNQWALEVPVAIIDDAPVAVDDSSEIDEGATDPVTGNVLDNDKFGADGRADDDSFHWNTDSLTSDGDGGYTLSYGTITLNADGTYSYVLDNSLDAVKALKEGESLTEEVTYTIKDKDGDVSTATLTITIKGQDNAITITPEDPDPDDPDNTIDLDNNNSIVTVYDSGLTDGTEEGEKPTATIGQFKIDAPDGLATITVNGAEIWKDGTLADETDRTFETDEGKLVITGYDPDTGTLTYTFTLEKPGTHPEDDELSREFTVSVTDTDGSEAEGKITVIIKDDEPIAEDDTNSIDEGAEEPITGDVVDNDSPGADGFDRVELVADPEGTVRYGELTLNEDGTYSYELDNDNETVMALKDGETLTETYTYKIYDKDGDYTEATLTITINGKSGDDPTIIPDEPDPDVPSTDPEDPDAHGAMIKVYEKHLPDGTSPDGDSLTVTGTMQVTAPDGLKNVKIGESVISTDSDAPTELTIGGNTLEVWLEVTSTKAGVVHYKFTLAEEMTHPDAETLDDLLSEYLLTVEDYEGKTGSCNLHVVIVDDGPEISVGEGQEVEIGEDITIPDFEAQFGADNGDGKSFVIKIDDKTYTFDSIEDVKDAKGLYGQIDYVEGKGLIYTAWAEQPEIDWDAIDWDNIDWDQLATYYDEDGNFDAISFLKDQGVDLKDEFKFTITDADGDKAETTWSVDLVKEATHGETDADEALKHVAVTASEKAIGDEVVISLPEGYEITEITEQPQHGTVSQNADGQWVYVLNHGIDSNVAMTMALGGNPAALVMEADSFKAIVKNVESGRTMPLTVPVHIHDAEPEIEGASETLEAGETVNGQVALDWGADDGESKMLVVAIDGQETEITDSATIQGKYGALTMSIDGSYSYENGTVKRFVMDGPEMEVSVPAGNRIADADLNIRPEQYINETNPTANIKLELTLSMGTKTVSGWLNAHPGFGDELSFDIGDTGYKLTIMSTDGDQLLIAHENGEWVITNGGIPVGTPIVNNDRLLVMGSGSPVMLNLTDKSGNPASFDEFAQKFPQITIDTLNLSFTASQSVPVINDGSDYTAIYDDMTNTACINLQHGGNITLRFEKALQIGDKISADVEMKGELTSVGVDEFTVYAVDADGSVSEATLTFDVKEPVPAPEIAAITADEAGMGQSVAIEIPDGYTIVEVVEQGQYGHAEQKDGKWVYTFDKGFDHAEDEDVVSGADSVKLKVSDASGKTWEIEIPVDIQDGEPIGKTENISLAKTSYAEGSLADFGADGCAKIVVTYNGEEYEVTDKTQHIMTEHGRLSVYKDGTYLFDGLGGEKEAGEDTFTFKVYDKDGDMAESTLNVTVHDAAGITASPVNLYESALRESGAPDGESASGTGSFLVNLYGQDGKITVGGWKNGEKITINNGQSQFNPATAKTLGNGGVEIKITGVEQQEDGQWKVSYSYELHDPQSHFIRDGEPVCDVNNLQILVENNDGAEVESELVLNVVDDRPTFSEIQHGQTQYEWIYSVDGENRTGLADKNGQMENNALYKSGTFAFEIGADGMEYGADTPFHLARMKDDGTFTSYSGFGVEVEGNMTTFYTSSRGKEATLTITDNGDGTFAYEFSDPFGICWDYDAAENFYLVASDADGNWTDPKQCGYIEIPVFGKHDYTYLGNVNPVDFSNSDTEELGYVNVTFAEGTGGLSATRETPMDGKVLIGEEGSQIAISIAEGKVASIMTIIDGIETEIPFTVSKYGALQFTGDPADGTITINGIQIYVEDIASNSDPGSWQITLNSTLIEGQDAIEWRYVSVTAINENGHEVHTELNFRLNNAPTSDTPPNSAMALYDDSPVDESDGPSFLDLFTEQQEMLDEMEKPEPEEKPEQTDETTSTFSMADLLAEEADYDEIVLPGSEFEPENGQSETDGQTNNDVFTSAADFAGDELAMLAAQHEVENV